MRQIDSDNRAGKKYSAGIYVYRGRVKRGASSSLFHGRRMHRSYARAIFLDFLRNGRRGFSFFFRPQRGRIRKKKSEEKGITEKGGRKRMGKAKFCSKLASRRRFMDSARSHLKDYIEPTITNRPFFSLSSGLVQFPALPFMISLFLPPSPRSRLSAEGRVGKVRTAL